MIFDVDFVEPFTKSPEVDAKLVSTINHFFEELCGPRMLNLKVKNSTFKPTTNKLQFYIAYYYMGGLSWSIDLLDFFVFFH